MENISLLGSVKVATAVLELCASCTRLYRSLSLNNHHWVLGPVPPSGDGNIPPGISWVQILSKFLPSMTPPNHFVDCNATTASCSWCDHKTDSASDDFGGISDNALLESIPDKFGGCNTAVPKVETKTWTSGASVVAGVEVAAAEIGLSFNPLQLQALEHVCNGEEHSTEREYG